MAGTAYRDTILAGWQVRSPDEVTDPTRRMWIEFQLSSLNRGRQAVQLMGGRAVFQGKRVLDVGCAYGGYLVAAAEAGATQVTGVDVDDSLLALARLQLADHNVKGVLVTADVTTDDFPRRFGPFDIILCNDVAEHVVDPEALARNLSALLPTGGAVFLQIPNGRTIDFMRSDGHYGLFGITLLDRERAELWWRLHYEDKDEVYGVEHYASSAYYLDCFSRHGISLRLLDPFPHASDLDALVDRLEERFVVFERELAELTRPSPEAPPLIAAIRGRGSEEIEHFRRLAARYRDSRVTAERVILGRTLFETYELPSWQFQGTKTE